MLEHRPSTRVEAIPQYETRVARRGPPRPGTLGISPGKDAFAAIEAALGGLVTSFNAQDLANTVWAYSSMGERPEQATIDALDDAAGRAAPTMCGQAAANS